MGSCLFILVEIQCQDIQRRVKVPIWQRGEELLRNYGKNSMLGSKGTVPFLPRG